MVQINQELKKIKGAPGFDDMYIKQGINWDLNQTKIVGVDPQLSYDVISNEFKKASSDIHESNTESDDETTEDNSAILDKLTLAKHHIVMKFTPFDNELKKSSFIVSSESVSKVTPGKLANMALASIKTLGFYGFQVCVVVADGATENNSFFEGVATQSIESHIPIDLKNKFPSIKYDFKNVMLHPITDEPIFFIADMPHLIKKIVNALEMSSLKKSKRNMKYSGCPLNSKMIQDVWRLTRKKSKHRLMEQNYQKNILIKMHSLA